MAFAEIQNPNCIQFKAEGNVHGFASANALTSKTYGKSVANYNASEDCHFTTKPSQSFLLMLKGSSEDQWKTMTCSSEDALLVNYVQDDVVCLNANTNREKRSLLSIVSSTTEAVKTHVQTYNKVYITIAFLFAGFFFHVWNVLLRKAEPIIEKRNGKWFFVNWGKTQKWEAKDIVAPNNFDELLTFIKNRKQNGVTNIRAFGALHSWSKCSETKGTNLDVRKLNRVLEVDQKNLRIKAEAGIQLKHLYQAMRANNMAIPTMPNIDIITLGGAVSNGTHGTNIHNGSFSSLVYAMELIDANGKVWNLTRDSKDPAISRYFDAALISFGSLGIIYSITMQCDPDYNMVKILSHAKWSELKKNITQVTRKYDSIFYAVAVENDTCFLKINNKIAVEGSAVVAHKDSWNSINLDTKLYLFLFTLVLGFKRLVKVAEKLMAKSFNHVTCITWDQYELIHHTKPFVNMEYAVPENKIQEAIDFVTKTFKDNQKYSRKLVWFIRPVGADDRGFLSATRRDEGTPSYYIDIPYQNENASEHERRIFEEIERGLLKLGGRCSFSRLFWNRTPTVLENFWDKNGVQWKKAKLELDPEHVFTNDLVNSIFFDNKVNL